MKPSIVLVVDDEIDIMKGLLFRLKQKGYQVLSAGNGMNALEVLRTTPVDMVLLDLRLPKLDGYQVLGRIRQDERLSKIPVVVLTAESDPKALDRLKALNPDRLVHKPYEIQDLIHEMEQVLKQKNV